jgi:perosamine synthetase
MTDKLETDDEMWLFRSYADESDVAAVTDVIQRGTWWANGPEIEAFERKMADVAGTAHGVAFNSGTSALYANLLAHGITDGEVIVPSFTFPATANAVVAAGARPVFADIERDSLALSAPAVEEALSPETAAIMPIHFGGDVAADIRKLRSLADAHGVPLLEDACHSPGASMDGDSVGSFGSAASFSFCFNKVLSTGEGGMVVTDSPEIRDTLRRIRSHGRNDEGRQVTYGHNFRLATMNAALGVAQVEKLDAMISEREAMASYLNDRLHDLPGVTVPTPPADRDRIYLYYNLRLDSTDTQAALAAHLADSGVPSRVTYEPVHLNRYYREEWGWGPGDLPVTEDVAGRVLSLPFHLYLDEDDLDYVVEAVRSFFTEA